MGVREKVRKQVFDTIKDYKMILSKDKILCAASGGKDSTVLLDILNDRYDVVAVTIDTTVPGYSSDNLRNLTTFCKEKGIELHVVSFKDKVGSSLYQIKKMLEKSGINYNYCNICGVLKRYLLNQFALEIGATKIATGHNIDDISQSILMNELRGNVLMSLKLVPVSGTLKDMSFVRRIKPLFFVREEDLLEYSKLSDFPVVYSSCPYSKDAYRRSLRSNLERYIISNPGYREALVMQFLKTRKVPIGSKDFGFCSRCKQPSANNVCSACEILRVCSSQ